MLTESDFHTGTDITSYLLPLEKRFWADLWKLSKKKNKLEQIKIPVSPFNFKVMPINRADSKTYCVLSVHQIPDRKPDRTAFHLL